MGCHFLLQGISLTQGSNPLLLHLLASPCVNLAGRFFTTVLPRKPYIYVVGVFLAVLGLRCCAWAFSSSGKRRLLSVAAPGILVAVASVVQRRL